ncbi:TPA: sugar O-acetyltransferase [Clostridioides difficile]|uniref:sugar O-acetyltransferase n=1 Tax=Clostridioides difficile TaxID=1496 RepID=UPI00093DC241|nr:sugar O-acetyltransferase [Clostridioides difficile]EGT5474124.1 sugar O-acetyltransferase [Clostridioides difficile]ELX4590525.1 sugar O-acetyltransferase [Clostridioides difficile]ELX4592121.1 sugar O-acetyltransferase [Clostridioides difficile]MBG0256970.1 sugar O-acetyltransferase [Clostridioides difficile]MBH7535453.1 sugar O-acetyltransferase [Clostridioides difficile]
MTEKEKMLSGKGYYANDELLVKEREYCKKLTRLFNNTLEDEYEKREDILRQLFGSVGKQINVEQNIRCDYGYNIHVGENFFANYDCIFLDVCKIEIGDNVMLAPNVQIYTAYHPIDAQLRNSGIEYGSPIKIGDNVWIGGGVIITPGITIGDNVVIGTGSVVTKDIPPNTVAVGNPCRVIKKIEE